MSPAWEICYYFCNLVGYSRVCTAVTRTAALGILFQAGRFFFFLTCSKRIFCPGYGVAAACTCWPHIYAATQHCVSECSCFSCAVCVCVCAGLRLRYFQQLCRHCCAYDVLSTGIALLHASHSCSTLHCRPCRRCLSARQVYFFDEVNGPPTTAQ